MASVGLATFDRKKVSYHEAYLGSHQYATVRLHGNFLYLHIYYGGYDNARYTDQSNGVEIKYVGRGEELPFSLQACHCLGNSMYPTTWNPQISFSFSFRGSNKHSSLNICQCWST